ncbi:hypothetical protein [Actinomadura sp. DC4]|uniref:hypothetical protein n=1 Tax=Actinomadura sp. DC4 TaxID=3055069 RepID=UPI0025B02020|nr:hypothetical protein [Actinomadura sp. DC4]MDN3360130.1 hypothetical protein [Actinomadura sp. DC4]
MTITHERTSEVLACFYRVERAGAARLSDGGGPFGFDIHTALLVEDLISSYHPAAVVETGCHLGDTTKYLAMAYPDLPVFTCDIDPDATRFTAHRLRNERHVTVACCNSPDLVAEVDARHSPGLYFLDAHWGEHWPLRQELESITSGIAVVHDFDIGHPRFSFDEYGGVRCGPELLAQVPHLADLFFTPDPEISYPLPCLQVGRRAGVGVVPIGVDPSPMYENPHLTSHSLQTVRKGAS